jgi:hypothetical protein
MVTLSTGKTGLATHARTEGSLKVEFCAAAIFSEEGLGRANPDCAFPTKLFRLRIRSRCFHVNMETSRQRIIDTSHQITMGTFRPRCCR